jgi:nicotinamide riboside transporter PnuC
MLDLFNTYRVDAQHIASILLVLAIWRWGAGPERWLIGIFVATMVVPVHIFRVFDLGDAALGPYAWVWAIIDSLTAVAFIAVALKANRNYPLWIAGFQLVAIGAHIVSGLVDAVSPLAYAILAIGPSYCQLLLIFGGFVRHVRRRRRFGNYRAWRPVPRRRSLAQA